MPNTNHITIELDLPQEVPETGNSLEEMRNAVVMYLYNKQQLTMSQASEIIGCGRREFEVMLPDFGFTMMDERDFDAERAFVAAQS